MTILVRVWRFKVKGQGHILVQVCGGEGMHIDAVRRRSIHLSNYDSYSSIFSCGSV